MRNSSVMRLRYVCDAGDVRAQSDEADAQRFGDTFAMRV